MSEGRARREPEPDQDADGLLAEAMSSLEDITRRMDVLGPGMGGGVGRSQESEVNGREEDVLGAFVDEVKKTHLQRRMCC